MIDYMIDYIYDRLYMITYMIDYIYIYRYNYIIIIIIIIIILEYCSIINLSRDMESVDYKIDIIILQDVSHDIYQMFVYFNH